MAKISCILLLIIAAQLCGCSHYYSLAPGMKGISAEKKESITLDKSYILYIRQVFVDTINNQKIQSNYADDGIDLDLLEVEYLFISPEHQNAIYVGTVPDKYQRYYRDSNNYKGEKMVNAYDFRRLCFGKLLNNNTIRFVYKDSSHMDQWNVFYSSRNNKEYLTINTVEQTEHGEFTHLIPVDKALERPIRFKRLDNFQLIFKKRGDPTIVKSLDNTIYFTRNKNKYEMRLEFESPNPGKKLNVYFSNKRIRYSPEVLF